MTSFIDAEMTPNLSVHLKTPQAQGPYLTPEAMQMATKLVTQQPSEGKEASPDKKGPIKVPKWLKLKK